MRTIKLCLKFYATSLKSTLEYRLEFVTSSLTILLFSVSMLVSIWILLDRFKVLQGWTLYEALFLYNLNTVAYGICAFLFYGPLVHLEEMVQRGEFDIVLVRPMNPLLYLVVTRPIYEFLGHMILGGAIFAVCFAHLNISLTTLKVVFLILDIGGAVLIYSASFLIVGALTFWIVKTYSIFDILTNSIEHLIDYPVSIYGKVVQGLFTFIIPFAFVNFFPARFFLDRKGDNMFNPILQYGTPLVGMVFFFLAYRLWKLGVKNYKSTGS